jgi:hypothetical protein
VPVEAQDALQVREQHFDLLPFTARSARLNVATFTFSGIAANCSGYRLRAISRCFRMHLLPMFRQPVLIFEAGLRK